jgi:hypothetical protein
MAIVLDGTNGIDTPDLASTGPITGTTGTFSGEVSGTTGTFSGNVTLGSSVLATPTGSAPSYTCRAWVNFNGTGTVAIRASGNVSSITDNGTGDYTVNFTTAMPDVNYSALTTGDNIDCGTMVVGNGGGPGTTPTTSAIRVYQFLSDANIYQDAAYFNVAIFR